METARPLEPLITVRHVSRLLGVGRHVLYRAAEAGEVAIFDAGGWARLRLTDLEAWLETSKGRPGGGR